METDGVLAEITSESFTECIGGPLEEILKKNEKIHEVLRNIINIFLYYTTNIKEKNDESRPSEKKRSTKY